MVPVQVERTFRDFAVVLLYVKLDKVGDLDAHRDLEAQTEQDQE